MVFERSLKLCCPNCRATGEFVYEFQDDLYEPRHIAFRSLTSGFSYRSLGTMDSLVITCSKCLVQVN